MSAPAKPAASPKVNALGLDRSDYKGLPSTLCPGCGHDSISSQIIAAAHEISVNPARVIKLSGIGCSSKSPAYFLSRSHGVNAVHGRMPAVATGAMLANRDLLAIGVSGDGDTGSIGFGQFKHLVRRNVPMVYIIENNGVYGLTKGQFSATADEGQTLKYAGTNQLPPLDLCTESIIGGAGFVARSFAGDAKQVRELLKAAMRFGGLAVLDIISPCVTFNNHDESTKSYAYGKEHQSPLHDISFVPEAEEIQVDYEPGSAVDVELHDGSRIRLKKLDRDFDPSSREQALNLLERARQNQEFVTGLLYVEPRRRTLLDVEHLHDTPIAFLPNEKLRPTRKAFDELMQNFS